MKPALLILALLCLPSCRLPIPRQSAWIKTEYHFFCPFIRP